MVEALAGVLEPKTELFATTRPMRRIPRIDWMKWSWAALPLAGLLAMLLVFIVLPRLTPSPPPVIGVVPCPAVSPSPPQLSANPNPAAVGQPVSFSGSGFAAGDPLFVVVDNVGNCLDPTTGAKVFSTSSYAEPLATDPTPLPDSIAPGDYQLRACNQRPGESPSSCVQVPFSIVPTSSPSASASPTPTPSP